MDFGLQADQVLKQIVKVMFRDGNFAADCALQGTVERFQALNRVKNGSEKRMCWALWESESQR